MKKALIGFLAVALVAGMSTFVYAGIAGSAHDFTDGFKGKGTGSGTGTVVAESWNSRNEICRVCHVPHDHSRPTQRYTNGLLWNHAVSSATYTMYDIAWSTTLTGTQSTGPDGTAKLCLGCHDGTVAIDTFDNHTSIGIFFDSTAGGYDSGFKVPGFTNGAALDLRGTHPISIEFPPGEAGDGTNFTNPASATWASGATVASTLDNGKVQCSTCHDVHAQEAVAGTHLLRTAQRVADGGVASGLCLTCHVK